MPNVSTVKSKFFGAVAATDADGISTTASISGAAALTINGALTSGGSYTSGDNIGQPITITSAGDDTGITFTVVGTNAVGDALTEAVTGAEIAAVGGVTSIEYVAVRAVFVAEPEVTASTYLIVIGPPIAGIVASAYTVPVTAWTVSVPTVKRAVRSFTTTVPSNRPLFRVVSVRVITEPTTSTTLLIEAVI